MNSCKVGQHLYLLVWGIQKKNVRADSLEEAKAKAPQVFKHFKNKCHNSSKCAAYLVKKNI